MIEERTWKCLIPSERVGVEPDRNHGHIEKVVLAIIWLELSSDGFKHRSLILGAARFTTLITCCRHNDSTSICL
jgi:hypothetical protein